MELTFKVEKSINLDYYLWMLRHQGKIIEREVLNGITLTHLEEYLPGVVKIKCSDKIFKQVLKYILTLTKDGIIIQQLSDIRYQNRCS